MKQVDSGVSREYLLSQSEGQALGEFYAQSIASSMRKA